MLHLKVDRFTRALRTLKLHRLVFSGVVFFDGHLLNYGLDARGDRRSDIHNYLTPMDSQMGLSRVLSMFIMECPIMVRDILTPIDDF